MRLFQTTPRKSEGRTLIAVGLSWLVLTGVNPLELSYLDVHGVVMFRFDYSNDGKPPVAHYELKHSDGSVDWRSDLAVLGAEFPVGTDIDKNRWSLIYRADGRAISPNVIDPMTIALSVILIILGLALGL